MKRGSFAFAYFTDYFMDNKSSRFVLHNLRSLGKTDFTQPYSMNRCTVFVF